MDWTKKILTASLVGLLLLFSKAVDAQMYGPVTETYVLQSCDYGCFEFFGEFIYWKPCLDDLDVAAELTDLSGIPSSDSYHQEINYYSLCPDWEPGFRVGFAVEDVWCDWRLSGTYTHVEVGDHASHNCQEETVLISPLHFPALTHPEGNLESGQPGFEELKGKVEITYRTWDVLLSRAVCSSECYVIAPFIGAEGLHLDQQIATHAWVFSEAPTEAETKNNGIVYEIDGSASTKWSSEFCAYGLKFGTDYIYRLGDCLKLFSRGSFTIATGDNNGKNRQSLTLSTALQNPHPVQSITAKEGDSCLFVNGYHIQVGFIYETEMCSYDVGLRLGYEFVKWHNVPRPRRFPGSVNNIEFYNRSLSTSPSKSTIGFHGLMAGMSLEF